MGLLLLLGSVHVGTQGTSAGHKCMPVRGRQERKRLGGRGGESVADPSGAGRGGGRRRQRLVWVPVPVLYDPLHSHIPRSSVPRGSYAEHLDIRRGKALTTGRRRG